MRGARKGPSTVRKGVKLGPWNSMTSLPCTSSAADCLPRTHYQASRKIPALLSGLRTMSTRALRLMGRTPSAATALHLSLQGLSLCHCSAFIAPRGVPLPGSSAGGARRCKPPAKCSCGDARGPAMRPVRSGARRAKCDVRVEGGQDSPRVPSAARGRRSACGASSGSLGRGWRLTQQPCPCAGRRVYPASSWAPLIPGPSVGAETRTLGSPGSSPVTSRGACEGPPRRRVSAG